jgi:hypothetical protein
MLVGSILLLFVVGTSTWAYYRTQLSPAPLAPSTDSPKNQPTVLDQVQTALAEPQPDLDAILATLTELNAQADPDPRLAELTAQALKQRCLALAESGEIGKAEQDLQQLRSLLAPTVVIERAQEGILLAFQKRILAEVNIENFGLAREAWSEMQRHVGQTTVFVPETARQVAKAFSERIRQQAQNQELTRAQQTYQVFLTFPQMPENRRQLVSAALANAYCDEAMTCLDSDQLLESANWLSQADEIVPNFDRLVPIRQELAQAHLRQAELQANKGEIELMNESIRLAQSFHANVSLSPQIIIAPLKLALDNFAKEPTPALRDVVRERWKALPQPSRELPESAIQLNRFNKILLGVLIPQSAETGDYAAALETIAMATEHQAPRSDVDAANTFIAEAISKQYVRSIAAVDYQQANHLCQLYWKVRPEGAEAFSRKILTMPKLQNSLGMKLKLLPPTKAQVTKGFFIGETEVTQQQFKLVMGYNPSHFQGETHPVENLSWREATLFCEKLSALPDEKGRAYRLPTSREWQYAHSAGTKTEFSFGDDIAQLAKYDWYANNAKGTTHPVGELLPSPWGLYDIYGNVREFDSTEGFHGYDWSSPRRDIKPKFFFKNGPDHKAKEIGLRVVMVLEE